MAAAVVGEIELEGVCSTVAVQVAAILCQPVLRATPVDTPVVVSTELVLAVDTSGRYLPATFCLVVGHIDIVGPAVEVTYDTDS